MPVSDETTQRAPTTAHASKLSTPVLALTLLAHPDRKRVGDITTSREGRFELSRKAPMFVSREGRELPLADRFVSRSPLHLALEEGALVVRVEAEDARVFVDGQAITSTHRCDAHALAQGMVIELAERVVVLVHLRPPFTFPRPDGLGMRGDTATLDDVRASILAVASLDTSVLVRGESGTGKELVARAIVEHGARAASPFVAVNVAALPTALAASELFGHARGAFTGAHRDHEGAFQRADGGTLFLDEIGDAPLDVQAMLLRVLETGEVLALGGHRPRHVIVRVIAATDADLDTQLADGAFKSALLHRLAGFGIDLPPLRMRRDDIGRLLYAFIEAELRMLGVEAWPVHDDALWLPTSVVSALARYHWPGNVRQLRNVARQIAIRFRSAPHVTLEPILSALPGYHTAPAIWHAPALRSTPPGERRRASEVDEDELIRILEEHNFRLGPVARLLGVSRPALYDRIEHCERVRKARDVSEPEIRALLAQHGDPIKVAEELRISPRGLTLRMRELGLR